MKHGPYLIPDSRDAFDTRFRRFHREKFNTLELSNMEDGVAYRYEVRAGDSLVAEIDVLPKRDVIEVEIACLEDNIGYCLALFGLIEKTYKLDISMSWISLLATGPAIRTIEQGDIEDIKDPDLKNRLTHLVESPNERLPAIHADTQLDSVSGDNLGLARPSPPPKPNKLDDGGTLDDWFDWYHDMKGAGFRCTLRDIAKETGYSYGHVKNKHMNYTAEHDIK